MKKIVSYIHYLGSLKNLLYFSRTITIMCRNQCVRLRVHSKFEENLFRNHEEKNLLVMLSEKLRPNDIIYDVGSHAGYHSIFLSSQLGKEGVVFAFEPNPNCFKYLKENISLNPKLRINAFQIGITDEIGNAILSFGEAYERSARLGADENWDVTEIETYSIDEFAERHVNPTILKIDVEGAEDLVIKGAQNLLKTGDIRLILLELHPTLISGGEDAVKKLRHTVCDYGYIEKYEELRRQQIHILYEKSPRQ